MHSGGSARARVVGRSIAPEICALPDSVRPEQHSAHGKPTGQDESTPGRLRSTHE